MLVRGLLVPGESETADDLGDGHLGAQTENVDHFARAIGIEMDHDDVGRSAIGRQGAEKRLQHLRTAGRRANADDHRLGTYDRTIMIGLIILSHLSAFPVRFTEARISTRVRANWCPRASRMEGGTTGRASG